jgi:ATP citrate (pro-S)-lyase
MYAGMKISDVIRSDLGIGGTIGLIWFRKRLPAYFCRFIELVLMVTADHGPAVAGAHNTIVAARAGKDLISALCSGLLTIGPRFGGALDGAAQQFGSGYDSGLSAEDFMAKMRRDKELIMGIGHKIKVSIHAQASSDLLTSVTLACVKKPTCSHILFVVLFLFFLVSREPRCSRCDHQGVCQEAFHND